MTEDLVEGERKARIPWVSQPAMGSLGTITGTADLDRYGEDLSPDPSLDASPGMDTDPYGPEPDRKGRTGTSASRTDKPAATAKEIGQLVAAVLVALAVAGSTVVRWRTRGRKRLRQPTEDQAAAVGEPLGRIAYRHIPLPKLVPDLADAVQAAVAINRYLDDGSLTVYADHATDSGMPADLNQEIQ